MTKPKKETVVEEPAEDHIDEHNQAIERLVAIAENAEFESGTLVGDIRDTLLNLFKNRPKPWSQLSEIEQRDTGRALENVAKTFIRKAVIVIAEEDLVSVNGTMKGYTGKGGLFVLKVEARGDEDTATELFRMDGHDVVIMSADHSRFAGQKGDAEVQPDSPALPFEADANGDNSDNSDLAESGDEDSDEEILDRQAEQDESAEQEQDG
jgi:hypothetical protein